jgi:peptide/nickel transport system substrate-binding protein
VAKTTLLQQKRDLREPISLRGVRNPDYYHRGLPYLDGFTGIYADKQAVRVAALRSDRAAIEFRGLPPSVGDELVEALGDKIAVQDRRAG